MKAFFLAVETTLTAAQLAAQRRKLAEALKSQGIEMETLRAGNDLGRTLVPLALQDTAVPVVAIDDAHTLPQAAEWLRNLTANVQTRLPMQRPQVVYVTSRPSANAAVQLTHHPVVQRYIGRDAKGRWVDEAAAAVREIVELIRCFESAAGHADASVSPGIVGGSPRFLVAIEELGRIMESPYGIVTGEPGVGKMYLIRRLWRHIDRDKPLVVLPCASFFKDYYIGLKHGRVGGGRESVDQLMANFVMANRGMLVLHHVEQLPTAIQEELAVR